MEGFHAQIDVDIIHVWVQFIRFVRMSIYRFDFNMLTFRRNIHILSYTKT